MLVKVQKLILMIFSTPTWPSSKSGCFIDSSTKIKKLPSRDQAMFNEAANFDVTTCRLELLCMKSCWKWHLYEHRIEANPQHKALSGRALMPRNLATSVNNMTSRVVQNSTTGLMQSPIFHHHTQSPLSSIWQRQIISEEDMTVFIVLMETLEENSPSFSKKGETISLRGWRMIYSKSIFWYPLSLFCFGSWRYTLLIGVDVIIG